MSRRTSAHARSKKAEAKKSRRNKRRASRNSNWLPDDALSELVTTQAAIAADLEAFDARIAERGWAFDEDDSDEEFAFWLYPPSSADLSDDDRVPVTTIWMSADEDAQIVHLMLVGAGAEVAFEPEALLEHLDTIEAYRLGDPVPEFG